MLYMDIANEEKKCYRRNMIIFISTRVFQFLTTRAPLYYLKTEVIIKNTHSYLLKVVSMHPHM